MDENKKSKLTGKELRSVKVALFCLIAVLVFYFGVTFLKGINIFGKKRYYYAVFENVGALHESTNVTMNGFQIGKVTKIGLMSTNPTRICAEILVTENLDIPDDSYFEVAQKDLLGGVIMNLKLGSSNKLAVSGDTLSCGIAPGMFDGLDGIMAQLNSVISSIDTIGQSVKVAFLPYDSANGGVMIKNTLENLQLTTQRLSSILDNNGGKVDNIFAQLDKLSKTLGDANPQIESIVANVDNITDSLAQSNIRELVNNAQKTIDDANKLISNVNNGQGTVGQLMSNDSLYKNINKTIESVNQLVGDIKENPQKYINVTVFGRKNKQ